jgi:hypothetical protein
MFVGWVLFLIASISFSIAEARCLNIPTEDIRAEFKITGIEKTKMTCQLEESGTLLKEPISFEQPGCVVRLEFAKLAGGKMPVENQEKNGVYGVYARGDLCRKKPGDKFKGKLKSTKTECCAIVEAATSAGEFNVCKMKPVPQLVAPPSEDVIRCSAIDVHWKLSN